MTDTIADPFAQATNLDDPFATADDVKGGGTGLVPSPITDGMDGCLVAMIPTKFEAKSPKPEGFRQNAQDTTRERYTVDLYVLEGPKAGAAWTFGYTVKADGSEDRDYRENTVEPGDFPYHVPGYWVTQLALVGQLRKVADSTKPIVMGRMRRGPQAPDRGKKTFESIAAEWASFVKRGKVGNAPKFSWQVDVAATGTEDHGKALAWWRSAGIKLSPVVKVD